MRNKAGPEGGKTPSKKPPETEAAGGSDRVRSTPCLCPAEGPRQTQGGGLPGRFVQCDCFILQTENVNSKCKIFLYFFLNPFYPLPAPVNVARLAWTGLARRRWRTGQGTPPRTSPPPIHIRTYAGRNHSTNLPPPAPLPPSCSQN